MAEVTVTRAELAQSPDGQWHWTTFGANGEPIGWGERYKDERDADASLRAHLSDPETPVERVPDPNI